MPFERKNTVKKPRRIVACVSVHHGNTRKIADVIAKAMNAAVMLPEEVDAGKIEECDIIGFGSGIYMAGYHKSLDTLLEKLQKFKGKKAFTFSTRGISLPFFDFYTKKFRRKLNDKGFDVLGDFSCLGFDTYGPLALIGGINKGSPGEKDIRNAEKFAARIMQKSKKRSL